MEALKVVQGSLTPRELFNGLGIAVSLGLVWARSSGGGIPTTKASGLFLLFVLAQSWLALVDHYVPEPYLVSLLLGGLLQILTFLAG